jgi:hypothetical protein
MKNGSQNIQKKKTSAKQGKEIVGVIDVLIIKKNDIGFGPCLLK